MPNYDYVCDACGHEVEIFHSMSEDPRTECPACGKPKLRRLIGAGAGIIFKGGGFYETDYKRKSGSSEDNSGSSEKKSDSSGGGGCGSACGCNN